MMEYKGYTAKIEYDDQAGHFHGQVINLRDVITFQGRSVDELRTEFAASVDDYLAFCRERGEQPEKPYSGKFVLRIDPALHRLVAIEAGKADLSVNAWVSRTLEQAVAPKPAPNAVVVEAQRMIATYLIRSSEQAAKSMVANMAAWAHHTSRKPTASASASTSVTTSRIKVSDIDAAFSWSAED
jgi:predicted HicB family RNase H-like nuclease